MQRGFTLVEILVSVGIFATVMVIALGALLAMSESDRKAQSLKSVINNLNFSLESMSRSIRTGFNYHCGTTGSLQTPLDCTSTPASYFAFQAADGTKVAYCLSGGAVRRQITVGSLDTNCGSSSFASITSPEVSINALRFYVIGAESASIQPKVTLLLSGSVQVSGSNTSTFNLQTSVTQRLYDR